MTRIARVVLVCALLAPASAFAGTLYRFTLVVGANNGGQDRVRLKYAVADAERVARVMAELGGVPAENEVILREPRVEGVFAALDAMKARLGQLHRASGDRTELLFYYSGHADEQGLLIGADRLSYQTLRDRLDGMPADLRIAVLDACASGAFTRLKGGRRSAPFAVDPSSATHGHAFITSSAENESAQESDRIGSSFFTHFLVSGFRGAADMSGDGRVTLNEAYQFAFAETLGRTVNTSAGAQHPSYDINLSGAGDVVMTDVRQTTARLVLPAELEGRYFIRDAGGLLIAELFKARGRAIEIAVEPGKYDVRLERADGSLSARTEVAAGSRIVLAAQQFSPAATERTVRRGADPGAYGADLGAYSVAGRNRLTLLSGLWGSHGGVMIQGHNYDFASGVQYARYLRDDLAIVGSVIGYGAEAKVDLIGGIAVPITVQWNPRRGAPGSQRLKPFLSGGGVFVSSGDSQADSWNLPGFGPAQESQRLTRVVTIHTSGDTQTGNRRQTVGATVGAGFDFQVKQSFALGVSAAFNFVPELTDPSGLHDNFGGPDLAVRIGWLFGKGR